MKQFRGKRVLVTGAASGIGRLLAEAFATRGSEVVVVDRDAAGADATARAIKERGQKALSRALDVTKLDEIAALERDLGAIDGLVNNAGVVFGGLFEQVPIEQHLNTYRVNVEGVVAMTHAFLPHLLRSDDGHIVNIASASGFIGLPYGSTYASSKWAVIGFSESLRVELSERGISNLPVTTVCPGYISTGMFAGVKTPGVMPMLTPERITAKIMEGVERNAAFVKEPFVVKTIDALKVIAPRVVFDQAAKLLGVTSSMQPWKGRSTPPA
ncbi:MAG: SDR family NAD(P)-dependent oxidoreductase [Polyangiales bacterium]